MSDTCLVALAKNADNLHDKQTLVRFLESCYGVNQYWFEIHNCLRTYPAENLLDNIGSASSLLLVPRSDRKEALKIACASKKIKYMDDPVVAEAAQITALRDQWLIQQGKSNANTKARIKKAANAEKKEKEKQAKTKEKGQQLQNIRRLALTNRQVEVGAFRAVLSDPASSNPPELPPITQTPTSQNAKAVGHAVYQDFQAKKKASKDRLKDLFNAAKVSGEHKARTATPPPVRMKLIRPSKQKVRIPINAVENTPPKQMRQVMNT